jgi:hypothetical protein
MVVRRALVGQSAVELALVLGVLAMLGVTAGQTAGLGLTAWKVQHAAQVAAYSATSDMVAPDGRTPCWMVAGGLKNPGELGAAPVCQAVVRSLGGLDPNALSLVLSADNTAPSRPGAESIQVTVTYREPVTSPLLRVFIGDTFTAVGDASAWVH